MAEKEKQTTFVDPDNYRKLCEPFASVDEANENVTAFWDAFYELRNKYRLADVTVVARINVVHASGDEGDAVLTMHAGDSLRKEPMLAYAFGEAQAEREEQTAKLMARAIKKTRTRP